MNSWRLALRMARREIGRDRGRSAFIWLMILLPVIAICALQIVLATSDISDPERQDLLFGTARAELENVGSAFVPNYVSGGATTPGGDSAQPARPVPGWGDSVAAQQAAVAALLSRPVVAVTQADLELGRARTLVTAMGVDFGLTSVGNFVHNTHGRYPQGLAEALVTPAGVRAGLPTSGVVSLQRSDGTAATFTIVGTAEAQLDNVVDLVTGPDPSRDRTRFFVFGSESIGWDEAVRLAEYGFTVTSRELLAHPPAEYTPGNGELVRAAGIWMISAAALLEVALAVGPAFAIGAARQRRTLALAASNGATIRQLRRAAIGQALLLGSSAAALGTVLGTAAGAALAAWQVSDRTQQQGPIEFPVGQLALAFVAGTATAAISALVTSRGLGKLDLVSALRGSVRPAPPRRGAPLLGAGLAVVGVAGTWLSLQLDYRLRFWGWTLSGVTVLVGCLLLVPAVLQLLSSRARRVPVAARMALRDSARQHGRATSTVAAVLAGGVILTAILTLILSQDADAARRYWPDLPMGQAHVDVTSLSDAGADAARTAVLAVRPGLEVFSFAEVTGYGTSDSGTLDALPDGCTTADLSDYEARCFSLGTSGSAYGSQILVGSLDDLTAAFSLDAAQRDALASGGLLVNTDPAPATTDQAVGWAQNRLTDGHLTFVQNLGAKGESTVTLPALSVGQELIARGTSTNRHGGLLAVATAERLHWATQNRWLQIADPSGPISTDVEASLKKTLEPWAEDARVWVERGYESTQQPVMWIITVAVVLVLIVAAVIATVMSTAELRPFLGTFAAVGADPRLNRRLAAVQGGLLTVIGTVLGVAIGATIAAPLAFESTGSTSQSTVLPPVVVLPWLPMAALVVVVPAIAAGVAAWCAPRRISLGRRLG